MNSNIECSHIFTTIHLIKNEHGPLWIRWGGGAELFEKGNALHILKSEQ